MTLSTLIDHAHLFKTNSLDNFGVITLKILAILSSGLFQAQNQFQNQYTWKY